MKTINNILVPIDFTEHSFTVLQHAVEIAKYSKAQIIMLHVYNKPLLSSEIIKKLEPNLIKMLEKTRLAHLMNHIQDQYNHLINSIPEIEDIHTKFIKCKGLVVEKIIEKSEEENVDLIIMGTWGARGFNEFWGTKTAEVCLTVKTPVLAVPYKSVYIKPKKIAFAYDLKIIRDIDGLNLVKMLSHIYNAEIHIITIHKDCKISTKEADNIIQLKKHFEEFSPTIHQQCGNKIEEGLFNYLKSNNISLLVTLHRSHKLLENLFQESYTERFVYHSNIPVLALDERD